MSTAQQSTIPASWKLRALAGPVVGLGVTGPPPKVSSPSSIMSHQMSFEERETSSVGCVSGTKALIPLRLNRLRLAYRRVRSLTWGAACQRCTDNDQQSTPRRSAVGLAPARSCKAEAGAPPLTSSGRNIGIRTAVAPTMSAARCQLPPSRIGVLTPHKDERDSIR